MGRNRAVWVTLGAVVGPLVTIAAGIALMYFAGPRAARLQIDGKSAEEPEVRWWGVGVFVATATVAAGLLWLLVTAF